MNTLLELIRCTLPFSNKMKLNSTSQNIRIIFACHFLGTSIGDVYGSLYEPQTFGSGGAEATNSSAKGWFSYHTSNMVNV